MSEGDAHIKYAQVQDSQCIAQTMTELLRQMILVDVRSPKDLIFDIKVAGEQEQSPPPLILCI